MDDENFKNNEIWLALNFENPQIFFNPRFKKEYILHLIQRDYVYNWSAL